MSSASCRDDSTMAAKVSLHEEFSVLVATLPCWQDLGAID